MGEEANSAIGECAALDFGSTSLSFGGGGGLKIVKRKGSDRIMARKMNNDTIPTLAFYRFFFFLITNSFLFERSNRIKFEKYQ